MNSQTLSGLSRECPGKAVLNLDTPNICIETFIIFDIIVQIKTAAPLVLRYFKVSYNIFR